MSVLGLENTSWEVGGLPAPDINNRWPVTLDSGCLSLALTRETASPRDSGRMREVSHGNWAKPIPAPHPMPWACFWLMSASLVASYHTDLFVHKQLFPQPSVHQHTEIMIHNLCNITDFASKAFCCYRTIYDVLIARISWATDSQIADDLACEAGSEALWVFALKKKKDFEKFFFC